MKQVKTNYLWQWFVCFLFFGILCLCPSESAKAAIEYTYEFKEKEQAYYITDVTVISPEETIVLPTAYDGYPVIGLGGEAFYDKLYIKKVIVPEGYTTIEQGAFGSCYHLEEVIIKAQIDTLYPLFGGCNKLKKVELPNSIKTIKKNAFYSCGLKELTIPASVTNLEGTLCGDCQELEKVVLNAKIKTLKGSTFSRCPNLKEIILPNTLEKMEQSCIRGCGIETLTIPASVTSVANAAIGYCEDLYQVICKGDNTEFLGYFYNNPKHQVTIVAKRGSTSYMSALLKRYVVSESTKFEFSPNGKKMFVGEKKYLRICNNPHEVEWTSSNEKVVEINEEGCLTAKKKGSSTITAKINGKKYKYKITVVNRTEKNVLNIVWDNYVTEDMTDYEKVVAANIFLAQNTKYNGFSWSTGKVSRSAMAKQTLTEGKGTCTGYAYAYKKILDHYGIENKIVKGSAKNKDRTCKDHIWNMVKIGTRWYHVDVTWNDPTNYGLEWNYFWDNYLLLSNNQMDDDHKWTKKNYPTASKKTPDKKITTVNKKGITISTIDEKIKVGKSMTLKVAGTKKKITWSSSNKKIVTVNSKGKIIAKKKGTATIYFKVNGKKYAVKVTVTK